ncbi:hypothetical protein ACLBYG_22410 [Methylobacterium sp. D53M]
MALLRLGIHDVDVAFGMDPTFRKAMLIADGLNRGGDFDFGSWEWRKQD